MKNHIARILEQTMPWWSKWLYDFCQWLYDFHELKFTSAGGRSPLDGGAGVPMKTDLVMR